MNAFRDTIAANAPLYLSLGGLVIGCLFGAIVFRTNFCAMGSLADIHNFADYRRFRAWILAAATALLGAQLLHRAGIVALDKSMYLAPSLNWTGNILGGLLLGFGMVYAGGCPSRNLARAGGGDLRALITLVILGLVAFMTIGGLFAPVRSALEQTTSLSMARVPTQGIGDMLAAMTGTVRGATNLVVTMLLVAAALGFCFADYRFRNSPVHILSGIGIGLTVVVGWALTGLAFDDMMTRPVPPISLTYVRPTGESLQWLTLFTATPLPGFGAASVFGALIGACAAAVGMGRFHLAAFSDTADMLRHLLGASLMGIGGVMAMGCTIGQAITGVSTLALGSFVTFGAIVAGGLYGLKVLERQILGGAWIRLQLQLTVKLPQPTPEAARMPIATIGRRDVLIGAAATLITPAPPAFATGALVFTPGQTEGPFYPVAFPTDMDADLVRVQGRAAQAVGQITHVMGRVLNRRGESVPGATVEIWQCDAHGIYNHPEQPDLRRRDAAFQGYGRMVITAEGRYAFRTIRPVAYPGRTPHIHFKVHAPGVGRLTTQMYVAGERQNASDGVLRGIRDPKARESVIVRLESGSGIETSALQGTFDIVLAV